MKDLSLVEIENQSLKFYNYELFQQVDALRDEIKCLREALEYYANKDIYFVTNDDAAEFDQGEKARKALSSCK